MLKNLFLFFTKFHLCHNFIFFCCANNMFFINHALKFKYPPSCIKVNFLSVSADEGFETNYILLYAITYNLWLESLV